MTDERFDRDLRQILGEIAGRDAPASLRDRIAQIVDEAPVSRRVWFAVPLRLSLAAVTVVAVAALALVIGSSRLVGPNPSASPAGPTPSVLPSVSPGPTTTQMPTPTPLAAWTGLDWSSGPGVRTDDGYAIVSDALRWGDGYVGVGHFIGNDGQTVSTAFFASPDGTHWTLVQRIEPVPTQADAEDAGLFDMHVIATTGELLAVTGSPMNGGSAPALFQSADGRAWSRLDSPTWRDAWDANLHGSGQVIAIAARRDTVVAVGVPGPRCCDSPGGPGAIIVTSTNGQVWNRLEVPSSFDDAFLGDVTAFHGGFAIVGGIGRIIGSDSPPPSVMAMPAAWTSTDGLTWSAAEVDGAEGIDVGLDSVVAGHDGLFAAGRRAGVPSASLVGDGVGATSGWASADGRTWRLVGDLGSDLPDIVKMAGDGTRMVILGRDSCKATDVKGWVSTDGRTWSSLAFTGSVPQQTIPGPICQDDGTEGWNAGGQTLTLAVVVPDGVLATTLVPMPQGPEFRFARAVSP